MKTSVVIVGAGVAGLTCAVELERRGVDYVLLEASDQAGGRVRTDVVEGFLLDRGFQVVLKGYPELRRLWNVEQLRFRSFRSGARILHQGRWLEMPDPLREPWLLRECLTSPVGTWMDKLRVASLVLQSLWWTEESAFQGRIQTTEEFLLQQGFSRAMLEQFWRPFFGGVFLDRSLQTGADFFRFLFRLFSWSRVAIPALGMQEIPRQIEQRLDPGRLLCNTRVVGLEDRRCWDDQGRSWEGEHLVVAVDGPAAASLLGEKVVAPPLRGTWCTYFSAPTRVLSDSRLHLVTDPGPVAHMVELSQVSSDYAPPGSHLLSISSEGPCSESELRQQLSLWFGPQRVESWRFLRQYAIPQALPGFGAGQRASQARLGEGLWRCGDAWNYPSLNGAISSGRKVAEALGYGEPK